MIYEILYTVTILALAVSLIYSWRKNIQLEKENSNLHIELGREKVTTDVYKSLFQLAKESIKTSSNQ